MHLRTEGNPLFMINVVDAWQAQGLLEVVEGEYRLCTEVDELAQGVPESSPGAGNEMTGGSAPAGHS